MFRTALLALSLVLPGLAAAQSDLGDLSDAERAAFRAEVRAYLLENPEVLMEAIAVLEEREAAATAARDMQLIARNAEAIFAAEGDLVLGNPEGDVTLVEFLDYRCGYCRRALPELEALLEADGDIRLVIKEFPILGEQSTLAARFALSAREVAGDAAYEDIHHALMAMRSDVTEPALRRLADDLGYDGEAILAGISDPAIDETIARTYALAQTLEISGTPTFVLGTELVRGFVPAEVLAGLVEAVRDADG